MCVALCAVFAALVALCFRGVASPVHAEEAPVAPVPIQINGDTAKVAVTLYTDEDHLNKLNGPVTSTSHFY